MPCPEGLLDLKSAVVSHANRRDEPPDLRITERCLARQFYRVVVREPRPCVGRLARSLRQPLFSVGEKIVDRRWIGLDNSVEVPIRHSFSLASRLPARGEIARSLLRILLAHYTRK